MKKFSIILEAIDDYQNIKDELLKMIQKSLNTSDSKTVESFIEAYKKDKDKNQIDGLINDADIYDFYLKYQDDIDSILTENNFFDKTPKEMNVYSLYSFIIKGTTEAVDILINNL